MGSEGLRGRGSSGVSVLQCTTCIVPLGEAHVTMTSRFPPTIGGVIRSLYKPEGCAEQSYILDTVHAVGVLPALIDSSDGRCRTL